MAKPYLKEKAATRPAPGDEGVAGDAGASGGGPTAPEAPRVLTQEGFRRIGETLNGTHWQSDVAREIGISKSQITRYLDTSGNPRTSRPIPPSMGPELQHIINGRILELAELIDLPGMPWAGTDQAVTAKALLADATRLVEGKPPARFQQDAER